MARTPTLAQGLGEAALCARVPGEGPRCDTFPILPKVLETGREQDTVGGGKDGCGVNDWSLY